MIDLERLRDYLPRQRWFAADASPQTLTIVQLEVIAEGPPPVVWTLVDADGVLYQVPVLVHGEGELTDALEDRRGALCHLDAATKGAEGGESVRPMGVEQSHTSVVVDERIVLKVYRRIHDGPNPEVEITTALATHEFPHVISPLSTWERDGRDLAIVQPYLSGSTDGWALSLASLRDLYVSRCPPEECGGDFEGEAGRLGAVIGGLHVAMADVFGVEHQANPAWRQPLVDVARSLPGRGSEVATALEGLTDLGGAIRVHGDLHLGQTLRTDAGWFVVDFEGEPSRPLSERRRLSSPLKDVAGMLRSFGYATAAAAFERDEAERDAELDALAAAWEARSRAAFLAAYRAVPGIERLLPGGDAAELVLTAFEIDKAVYEVEYERHHRPDWVGIPESALTRLLGGGIDERR